MSNLKTVHVVVTAEDTRSESEDTLRDCMCSRAINRATGRNDTKVAFTTFDFANLTAAAQDKNEFPFIGTLPYEVGRKIHDWCMEEVVEPFEFDIDIPADAVMSH